MNSEDRLKTFTDELHLIHTARIRIFAEEAIKALPDYFFEVAASSTGKYHPQYSLGVGGLVRHTKAAIRFAVELFKIENFKFDRETCDLLIAALLIHDGRKSGEQSGYTKTTHPLIQVNSLKNSPLSDLLTPRQFELVCRCVETHMGQWNKDYKTKVVLLPKPRTTEQLVVHLADYLASRKSILVDFNIPIDELG